jgi:CDP-2,3-bis-(O-geranylgeranyl)-sn-glycerol synthase
MEGDIGTVGLGWLILTVLWLYLPGFLVNTWAMMWGKWLPKTGFGPWPIDGGRIHKDGNRLLGDGKTWNGLIGGSATSGLQAMLMAYLVSGNGPDSQPFVDIMWGVGKEDWFWMGGTMMTAFFIGSMLGLSSLVGDSIGSYIKRRRGLKREGDISSKAPILDTLPFAIATFSFGILFLGGSAIGDPDGILGMLILLLATPFIHRLFNQFGFWLGWKDVPY